MLPSAEVPSVSPVPTIRPSLSCTSMGGLPPVVPPAVPPPLLSLPPLSVVSVQEACICQNKPGAACFVQEECSRQDKLGSACCKFRARGVQLSGRAGCCMLHDIPGNLRRRGLTRFSLLRQYGTSQAAKRGRSCL